MDDPHPAPWTRERAAPPLADLSGEAARVVRARRATPVNLYRSLAHAPALLDTWMGFTWGLREHCTTPRALRELVILRTAVVMRSAYEWQQHVAMALAAGVTPGQVDAVVAWQVSELFDPAERAALLLTDAVLTGSVPDAVHEELARYFTDAETVELVLTAGCYTMVPRVLDALRVPLEGSGPP